MQRNASNAADIIQPPHVVPPRISIEVETSTLSITDYPTTAARPRSNSVNSTDGTMYAPSEHSTARTTTTIVNSVALDTAMRLQGNTHYRGATATEPVDVEDIFAAIRTGWTIPTMPAANTLIHRTAITADDVVCVPPNISPYDEQRILRDLRSVSIHALRDRYRELKPAYLPTDIERSAHSPPLIFRPPTTDSEVFAHPRRPIPSEFRILPTNTNRSPTIKPTHSTWTCIPISAPCRPREPRHTSIPRHFQGVKVDLSYYVHLDTDAILLALIDTPVKIGMGFHGYCAKRIGDFMIGGFFASLRGVHIFMLMRRPASNQPSTFVGPRLLAVPREFVENPNKVLPMFEIQEIELLNTEWCHVL